MNRIPLDSGVDAPAKGYADAVSNAYVASDGTTIGFVRKADSAKSASFNCRREIISFYNTLGACGNIDAGVRLLDDMVAVDNYTFATGEINPMRVIGTDYRTVDAAPLDECTRHVGHANAGGASGRRTPCVDEMGIN